MKSESEAVQVEKKHTPLSPAEWSLMEYIWETRRCTGREAAEYCARENGWSRTTTLTLLRRMVDKGAVACDESGKINRYTPLIEREDAAMRETGDFLRRVYKGSVSMMLSAMTRKRELSRDEIEELREILRQAEEEGEK